MYSALYYTPSGRTTSGKAVASYISTLVIAYCFAIAYTLVVENIHALHITAYDGEYLMEKYRNYTSSLKTS
jgi:hypothetical protein